MTRVYSTFRRALATGLIALLVAVSVLPVATHAQLFDDPYCDPHPLGADHAVPGSEDAALAVGSAESGQHCDVCHWLRSLRVFDPAPTLRLAPEAHAVPSSRDLWVSPETGCLATVAARAPPA